MCIIAYLIILIKQKWLVNKVVVFLALCSHVIFAISDVKAISKIKKSRYGALEWVMANAVMHSKHLPLNEQVNVFIFRLLRSQRCCDYLKKEPSRWPGVRTFNISQSLVLQMWGRVSRHHKQCSSLPPPWHLVWFMITLNMRSNKWLSISACVIGGSTAVLHI